MYRLWCSKDSLPKQFEMNQISNLEFINVHTAIKGEYQFLLGSAITKYKDVWRISWGNSFRSENDDNTILAEKCSFDNGKTWTDYKKISVTDKGFGRSHGVYFEYEGELYAFSPKAKFNTNGSSLDLVMEAYILNEDEKWNYLGIVLEEAFWPMCEPVTLDNGSILMAGLKIDTTEAAIAVCNCNNLKKWEMNVIPNPENFEYWGETTVLKQDNKLLALVRGGSDIECILVSESYDNGLTWSGLEKSNFEISNSKMYAGTLSNGYNYLVFSAKSEKYRETLCIAIGKELFDKVYVIRHGFETPPVFSHINEWCYPYAYEDKDEKKLYIVYAKNKEDCELAIIPTEDLIN